MKKTRFYPSRPTASRLLPALRTLLLCALGLSVLDPIAAAGSPAWRQNDVWDDGKAEFCAYEVDWARYGRSYPGRALLIAVKEPWAPDLEVKADSSRPDGFDVIKLNHVRDVPTGIYTYHQMASAFVRRDSGELRKLAVTSSEGCGISTAQMLDGKLSTSSYFDGQGDQAVAYPSRALPHDALALSLRDYLEGPLPESVDVFPTLMTGRFPDLAPDRFGIDRREGERSVPAGTFKTIEVELAGEAGWMWFSFAAEPPHSLVRYEDHQGTMYRLAKCERIAYWQMNQPGGESWLPESLR